MKKPTFICFFLLILSCVTSAFAQEKDSPQSLIVGTWRHISLVRVIDGTSLSPQQFGGSTLLEFTIGNTWVSTSPYNRAGGTYRWLESGEIETTTLESGLAIQVGTVSKKQVRVDSERLNLITVQTAAESAKFLPPPKPGVSQPRDVAVVSIFSRLLPQR